MSRNASIVEFLPENLKHCDWVTNQEQFDRIWNDEIDKLSKKGVEIEPTAGELVAFAMKCQMRILLGDEIFSTNLEDSFSTDEEIKDFWINVIKVLKTRIDEKDDANEETETE